MSFLNPLALFGLAAAAIPPLLHLLARRLPPVVPFPAVRYLAETEREHSRRLKLRNLLLLILRTLLLAVIALAAAQPVARLPFGRGHEPSAVGVVVDNSLSSGAVVDGRRVVDLLVDQANRVLDRAGGQDRIWLVLADGIPRPISVPEARQVLDTLSPWPVRLELNEGVQAVTRAMADDRLVGREVVVLSDLQATAFASGAVDDTRILVWSPPPLPPNRGVDSVRVDPAVWSPSGQVIATIGGADAAPATVRLTLNDRDIGRTIGGPSDRVVLSGTMPAAGWFHAEVRLDPDELRADDLRGVAIRVSPPAAAVALPGAGSFVVEAIDVLRRSGRARSGNDVVLADSLAGRVSIVFPPDDPALVGAVNRALEARGIAWRFGPHVRGEWQIAGALGVANGTPVFQRRRLEGSGTVLARAGPDPWLVRDGDVILVASRLDEAWTALPISAAFVPFLDRLINRIGAAPSWIVEAAPGGVVAVPPEVRSVETPEGPMSIGAAGTVTVPVEPGVYFLLGADADTIGALEVNHDPRESALAPATESTVRATLGPNAEVVSTSALDRELFRGARRADLAGPLLVLAVLLAAAELVISSAGGTAERRT